MIDEARNKTWRLDQKKEFGRRLNWAQKRAGYKRTADAIKIMEKDFGGSWRTIYSHQSGERVPDDNDTIDMYCSTFKVSRDFLLFGGGPEQDEYLHDVAEKGGTPINQAIDSYQVRSSQYGGVRYIPILTASNLRKLLTGEGNLGAMSQDHLPVPKDLLAGPNSFSLQIPADDQSMIGEGAVSFPPLSFVVIDPDQEIMPGKYALARLNGWQVPILRQYQAAFPYSATNRRYPFELHALNPGVRPIIINSADDCDLIGRVIFVSQAL